LEPKKESQLSLINGATHFYKHNGAAKLLIHAASIFFIIPNAVGFISYESSSSSWRFADCQKS